LGFAGHLPILKLHDAHGVRWPAVVREDELGDPEVARAEDAPHREALGTRLRDARRLDVVPALDALARLRVLEQCVLSVDVVLDIEVIRIGGSPVAIECFSNLSLIHAVPPVPAHWGPTVPCHRAVAAHAGSIANARAKGDMDKPPFLG